MFSWCTVSNHSSSTLLQEIELHSSLAARTKAGRSSGLFTELGVIFIYKHMHRGRIGSIRELSRLCPCTESVAIVENDSLFFFCVSKGGFGTKDSDGMTTPPMMSTP